MQQRYYDPLIPHFLSVDPVTAYSVGGAFNRYWYANANPYRMIDPDGRQAKPTQGCGDQTCSEPIKPVKPNGCRTRGCWQDTAGRWHITPPTRQQLSGAERMNVAGAGVASLGVSEGLITGTVYLAQGGTTPVGGVATLEATTALEKARFFGRAGGLLGAVFGGIEAFTGKTTTDRAHGGINLGLSVIGLVACNAPCAAGLAIYGIADTAAQFQTYTDPSTGETYTGWTALKHEWTDK